ncbi:MAG: MFS transporter [Microcoleus sp.]
MKYKASNAVKNMKNSQSQSLILWRQVGGLAVLQGAITLSWLLYRLYLPQLLAGFGFAGLDRAIGILEDALAVAIEPAAGWLSDSQRRWMGTRLPLIVVGTILSSVLFIAIPTVFIFGNSISSLRWILPAVIVAWAVAMALFRSPAVSLLGQYAPTKQLPQAMSLLVLAGGLAGAIKPVASDFILSLGPAVTFAIGSFVLLAAVAVLRAVNPDAGQSKLPLDVGVSERVSILAVALIALTGAAVAWGTRAMAERILPAVLETQFAGANVKLLMLGVAILMAFAALPAGTIANRAGNQRVLLSGLVATSILLLLMAVTPGTLAGAIVLAVIFSYSLVANGTVPFALSLMPPQRGGLGVGIYFGGFSLAMSLYSIVLGDPLAISVVKTAIVASIAFLAAAACIAAGDRIKPMLKLTNK